MFELEKFKCKSKIDYYDIDDNYIVDIKTCNSVKVDDIVESIKKYMYGIQAAFYLDKQKLISFVLYLLKRKHHMILLL